MLKKPTIGTIYLLIKLIKSYKKEERYTLFFIDLENFYDYLIYIIISLKNKDVPTNYIDVKKTMYDNIVSVYVLQVFYKVTSTINVMSLLFYIFKRLCY